ncbi:hypothetical protein ACSNOI_10015, partial [Actinomadura kijaniata]|uniref:hypothetical protein n=1 Tax=Actinomadura kijaniata TaxID=46161 RepID=UPI003F1D6A5B
PPPPGGPGFGGPGMGQPPFPPPPGAPLGMPPKRSNGALIAALVGGGLVVIILIAIVVVALAGGGKTPEQLLTTAAAKIDAARVVSYKGTVSGGGDTLNGELSVTKGARASGQVSWNGDDVTLLSADGKLYVKADSTYWKRQTLSSNEPYFLGSGPQWGKLGTSRLSLDFKDLTPATLASKLRQAARYKPKATETTVSGRKAKRISGVLGGTFYLSDSDDPELLRYESTVPRVSADITARSGGDASSEISEMRTRAGELKNSFDASVRPMVSEYAKGLCQTNSSSCRVRGKVRMLSSSEESVKVEVRFRLTAGSSTGRDLGNCTTDVTLRGSEGVWAECRVSGGAWSSWSRSGSRSYYQNADFKVSGASDTEIQSLQNGLSQE